MELSEHDANVIKIVLNSALNLQIDECGSNGCYCDIRESGAQCWSMYEEALKIFDCKNCGKPHEKTYGENNEWCENCVPY